jgi:hypothetical protein
MARRKPDRRLADARALHRATLRRGYLPPEPAVGRLEWFRYRLALRLAPWRLFLSDLRYWRNWLPLLLPILLSYGIRRYRIERAARRRA